MKYVSPIARITSALVLAGFSTIACGGGDGGGGSTATTTTTVPPAAAQNPCPAASLASTTDDGSTAHSAKHDQLIDADPRGMLGDVLWRHRAAEGQLVPLSLIAPRATMDVGEIAVMQDEGDLVAPPNAFDLQQAGLRFAPRSGGGYDVTRMDASFRTTIGTALMLSDDDSAQGTISFSFNFYGVAQSMAFVNSDGNVTFGVADSASSSRNISRLLSGPARVAPFFADLDPTSGGSIFLRSASDAFTVTWCNVRVFDSPRLATFQTTLLPDGTIEMKYAGAQALTATDGIAAISPGRTTSFLPVDLSTTASGAIAGNTGAIGERFALRSDLDLVVLAQKFYRTHGDLYDQLVVWTDEVMTPEGAFAFEATVANNIAGIGVNTFNNSSQFGSSRLGSLVQMDSIAKYPDDPATKFLGENTTLSVMGQEIGHRWLAYMRFSDQNRQPSTALLGRDEAHWSFFFNSDASVMEGNRIEDLGGGSFRTVAAVERYSLFDQYAMGLVRDFDVPPMFYVESPTNVSGGQQADSAPRVGVTFSGTRRAIQINQVVEVMGARVPTAADSPKVLRQAFLFVVGRNRTAATATITKIDRIRRAWETFFTQATEGRMRVETRLQSGT